MHNAAFTAMSRLAMFLGVAWIAAGSEAVSVERPAAGVLPAKVVIAHAREAGDTIRYAAERLAAELRKVHGLDAVVAPASASEAVGSDGAAVIMLLLASENAAGLTASRDNGGGPGGVVGEVDESYRVVVEAEPLRIRIMGRTPIGVWYGACAWLDSLTMGADGRSLTPVGVTDERPELATRITRGLVPDERADRVDDLIPTMDWWARWRMNSTRIGSRPDAYTTRYLAETHKRGIRVLLSIGVRNLCAADDAEVARCAAEFDRFVRLGGDGVSVLWDDLPHGRCEGHCDACRRRFGPRSLPREIVRVLEAFAEVAARHAGRPQILWCPPHYSADRYPEMADEEFFRIVGASAAVRDRTTMYHCEFLPERVALLDRVGLRSRIWWYNGLRTVYHVCHHWPERPEWRLDIPGLKSFGCPDFARFEVGWKTGIGVAPDGRILPPPDATWQALRTVPQRYQGLYPCMDQHPYHSAVAALFAWSPARFDQCEVDRVVFRALFGPGSEAVARRWSDLYVEFQVRIARPGPAPARDAVTLRQRFADWRRARRQIESCAASGRAIVPSDAQASVIARMREAEATVLRLARDHLGDDALPHE